MEGLKLTWRQRHCLMEQLHQTCDAHVYRRTLAILEVARGRSISQVAKALAVTRQSVYNWVAEYVQRRDPDVLRDEPRSGRPSHWSDDHQALLRILMERSPDHFGYFAVNWTVPLLQEQWEHSTGERLCDETIRRGLLGLGYVWKRGRYQLEPDPELEKKTPYPGSNPPFAASQRAVGGR